MSEVYRRVADLDGLPRRNGELVFEAPWQSRIFGMAVQLSDQGAFAWDDFRRRLVEEIARRDHDDYYASWLAALERSVHDAGIVQPAELDERRDDYLEMRRDQVF